MSKYGRLCKKCGAYRNSDNKEEVKRWWKEHRRNGCALLRVQRVSATGYEIHLKRPELCKGMRRIIRK